jgi:hypothetical protein
MQRLEAGSSTQRRERSGGQLVRSAELYLHRNSSPRARITTRFVTPWGAGRASGHGTSVVLQSRLHALSTLVSVLSRQN